MPKKWTPKSRASELHSQRGPVSSGSSRVGPRTDTRSGTRFAASGVDCGRGNFGFAEHHGTMSRAEGRPDGHMLGQGTTRGFASSSYDGPRKNSYDPNK